MDKSSSTEVLTRDVFAVDYGDVFTVPRTSIRRYPDQVQKKFSAIPELSIPCSLRESGMGMKNLGDHQGRSEEEKKTISKMIRERQK